MVKAARLAGLGAIVFFVDIVRDTGVTTLRSHLLEGRSEIDCLDDIL